MRIAPLLFLAACATGTVVPPAPNDEPSAPEPTACNASEPCDGGLQCHNGLCAEPCTADAECPPDEFCAADDTGLCHPREVTSCPETACASSQFCASGLCATQAKTACLHNPFVADDGCGAGALCMPVLFVDDTAVEVEACYQFPPCPPDFQCPVGPYGSVCSFGVIEAKDPMCVPGLCLDDANCPAAFRCVRPSATGVHGYCTDGRAGAACAAGSDCATGICDAPANGYVGRCL